MKKTFITKSAEETRNLGVKLSKKIRKGSCVCLLGGLGAGKTTFVQGLAKGLGVKERVSSPTFIIAREYRKRKFCHIDLYRVNKKNFLCSELHQYIDGMNTCVIEWAEKIKGSWPSGSIVISFKPLGQETREIIYDTCD